MCSKGPGSRRLAALELAAGPSLVPAACVLELGDLDGGQGGGGTTTTGTTTTTITGLVAPSP